MTRRLAVVALTLACVIATPAAARHHDQHSKQSSDVTQFCGDRVCPQVAAPATAERSARGLKVKRAVKPAAPAAAGGGYVTIATAAGIEVTVAPKFAAPLRGFIADLVARGYQPKKIHCLNYSRSHVPGSLHFRGLACDFDQCGWGCTARAMYHVADLAAKWGLRDGGEFRDWGHIDMGPHLRRARVANLYAAVDRYQRRQHRAIR